MKNYESDQLRKEILLQRLNSLSPTARMAILQAALEVKTARANIQTQKEETIDLALFANNQIFTAEK